MNRVESRNTGLRPRDSSPGAVFEKVLGAFVSGGFNYDDFLTHSNLLLADAQSPRELLEVLQRFELVEPLPEYAHAEILGLLNDAIERVEAQNIDSDTAPDELPASASVPLADEEVVIDFDQLNDLGEDPFPKDDSGRHFSPAASRSALASTASVLSEFVRPPAVEAAPLAARVRALEEQIARQNADNEALTRSYQRAKNGESAAIARTTALAAELGTARTALEIEQRKARDAESALAERIASADAARSRGEEGLRDSERHQTESRVLQDSLAAGNATLVQMRQALAEREAELAALQQEHAKMAPAADARAKARVQLEADLQSAQRRASVLAADFAAARSAVESEQNKNRELNEALTTRISVADAANSRTEEALRELERSRTESHSARELLATREAALVQARRSLADRETQLAALQQEHAKVLPALEARASALDDDVTAVRTALESERSKTRDLNEALTKKTASADAANSRSEEALRELERSRTESRTLRDLLAAREAALVQARRSLAERETQLAALQQEHAKTLPALEARMKTAVRLEEDLQAAHVRVDAISLELKTAEAAGAELSAQLERSEERLNAAAIELAAVKAKESSHLELLRTREWRGGFDHNMFRELNARVDAAGGGHRTLLTERDQLQAQVADLQKKLDAHQAANSDVQRKTELHAAAQAPAERRGNETTPPMKESVARGAAWNRRAAARATGVGIAVMVLAAIAWFFVHRTPPPPPLQVVSAPTLPNPGTVIRDCPTCPAMTVLPAGRFRQGSDSPESGSESFEKPAHWVAIGGPIAMATNTVTVDEFQEFIAAGGQDMQGCDTYDGAWKNRAKSSWKNPGFVQTGTHPVTCVSWNDAKAYASWLSTKTGHSYRLPSASEWEYAARAGGESVQPWNPDGSDACANANVADQSAAHRYPGWTAFACDDGYVNTAPVGSFKTNSLGLNDMLGNVFQWTEDCWSPDYAGAPTDGSARTDGNCTEHELRGGSWFSTPAYVRANYRNHFAADYRTSSVGIRLVRDIEQ